MTQHNGIQCTAVHKQYKKNTALQSINLHFAPHTLYGLLGRNGAGKSTLLACMAAQTPLTSGTVSVNGEPVWENRVALDQLCFARELNISADAGICQFKVRDYLELARLSYRHWDQEMEARLMTQFALKPKAKLSALSKGMLSMLTIIVALASKADYTFLDEPVAGLDVIARDQFYRLLLEEYQNTDRTFILSTHIIDEAADLFDQIIILHEGAVLLEQPARQLLEHTTRVVGTADAVAQATRGTTVLHTHHLGQSTVALVQGAVDADALGVTLFQPSLQDIFALLCGEG